MADKVIRFKVDGARYDIDLGDFNAIDAKDFAPTVGMPLAEVYSGKPLDLHVIAGLMWLTRRKTNPDITYRELAEGLTYGNLESADPSESPPEASGGDSETSSPPSPSDSD